MVLDAPHRARAFFEPLIADNLDLGRPEHVEILFKRDPRGRKPKDQVGGVFKTAIDRSNNGVTIDAYWRHSRVKQYLKDSRALRIETVVNSADALGVAHRLHNLPELQARVMAGGPQDYGSATLESWPWPAPSPIPCAPSPASRTRTCAP